MENVFFVIDGLLCGRPGPDAKPWNIDEIKASGITAIVSLDQDKVDFTAIEEAGLEHLSIKLPDSIPPTMSDQALWIDNLPKALGFISDRTRQGRKVMVHCWAGKDRTGVLLASYLVLVEGMNPLDAIKKVRLHRPPAMSSEGYEELFLQLMQKMLSGSQSF